MRQRGGVALGALIAVAVFAVVGAFGLLMLKASWVAYAAAAPRKAYSPAMLYARLGVAVVACAAAGAAGARVTRAGAWVAGALLFILSSYVHIGQLWYDYPVWYHVIYLALIVPVIGLAAELTRRRQPLRI